MQPHNFSCWNLSGDHFLSCFFPLVAVPEAPPHLAAALGSGRPSGPGLPAQAHWDDSSSAAPMWHLKHHCTCCFCVFPQPPETWKSSRTIFTRALARTSPREGTRECSFNNSRQTNERLFNTLLELHTAEDLPKSRMFLLVPHDPNSLLIRVCAWLSCACLFSTKWTIAGQVPLSMGFPRQEYWGGFPFPPPEDLPDLGIEPMCPALTDGLFATEPQGSPNPL